MTTSYLKQPFINTLPLYIEQFEKIKTSSIRCPDYFLCFFWTFWKKSGNWFLKTIFNFCLRPPLANFFLGLTVKPLSCTLRPPFRDRSLAFLVETGKIFQNKRRGGGVSYLFVFISWTKLGIFRLRGYYAQIFFNILLSGAFVVFLIPPEEPGADGDPPLPQAN